MCNYFFTPSPPPPPSRSCKALRALKDRRLKVTIITIIIIITSKSEYVVTRLFQGEYLPLACGEEDNEGKYGGEGEEETEEE